MLLDRRTALAATTFFCGASAAFPQSPPVCDNGGPYSAEAQGAQTTIQLDGSASFDPDGTPLTFFWKDECPNTTLLNTTSATPTLVVDHGPGASACNYVCNFHAELRVTSGGETVKCRFVTNVKDTTAPSLSLPPDLTAVWGIDEDPSNTGFASAVDVADPAPVVTYSDVRVPATICSGIEEWIQRTWVATDACGNQTSDVQVITLLSPNGPCGGGGTSNLELDPSTCVNVIDTTAIRGLFTAELFGTAKFDVSQVDLSTVRLVRVDAARPNVHPLRKHVPMGDWVRGTSLVQSQCSGFGLDGYDDLTLTFSLRSVIKHLGLDQLPPGTAVPLGIAGFLKSGQAFYQADLIVVQ